MNKAFGFLWLVWLSIFVVLEWRAVRDPRPNDTLSEWVWWAISHPPLWWTLAGFLVWLVVHFLSMGKWA